MRKDRLLVISIQSDRFSFIVHFHWKAFQDWRRGEKQNVRLFFCFSLSLLLFYSGKETSFDENLCFIYPVKTQRSVKLISFSLSNNQRRIPWLVYFPTNPKSMFHLHWWLMSLKMEWKRIFNWLLLFFPCWKQEKSFLIELVLEDLTRRKLIRGLLLKGEKKNFLRESIRQSD